MKPVTLTDEKPIPSIPFVMTNQDRDAAMLARVEIEAMKRFRCPEGFVVGDASEAEWIAAGGLPL